MKKTNALKAILLLLFLFSFKWSNAQSIPPTAEIDNSFYNRMNYVFNPLEKNRVPYGLLRDFAMEFTDLERYNGLVNDSNYVDYGDFFDIYQTLYTSRIHSNAGTWLNPTIVDSLWYLQRAENTITIGGLCYGYSSFRDDAYSSGLITVNNDQIYDHYLNGIWQSPYQTGLTLAFAPATAQHKGKNISLLIPSTAWFTNQQISSIQLNADDGNGYQNLAIGQAHPVSYPDSGLKTLNFKVMFANNQVFYSHTQIHIANAVNPTDDSTNQYRNATLATGPQEIESDEAYEGKKAKGYMTVRYANPNDPVLRRPLIIAEGYDPGNILAPEEKFGLNDIQQFDRQIRILTQNSLKDILIDNPQYDLVYVDWKKGTDDLYRNAKLLKKIIALVNAEKVAVNGVMQGNVIIGQSMGGVIARIALKEMENNNITHQTRLFISQDAPQQGANVPIGYQYMGRHFRNIYISTGVIALGVELVQLISGGVSPLRALSLSNEPASKQMLINYISDFGILNNTHHDNFYASLRTLGYPTQCRVIAMSNGSECASTQGFEPGNSLLSINGKIQTRFLGDVLVSASSYFVAPLFPLNRLLKLGFLPGRNEIKANLNLHAIGNNGGNQVYYCDITYTKKLFYFLNINLTLAHKEKNANSGMLPIDGYPGGFFRPAANLTSSTYTNWFFKYNINVIAKNSFNFIPTTSSLDIGNGATALNGSDYLRVYSASSPPASPKQTPFANFIVGRQIANFDNENHISFTVRNADWVGNEIGSVSGGPNPQIIDCTILCSNKTIVGSSQFCSSDTYSIPNLPTGVTVSWSASPANIVSISTNNNVATLSKIGSGTFQLTATILSPCGPFTTSKSIQTAPSASSSFTATPHTGMQVKEMRFYISEPFTLQNTYQWQLDGSTVSTGAGYTLLGPNCGSGQPYQTHYQVTLIVTNSCGQVSTTCRKYVFNCTTNSFSNGAPCGEIPYEERTASSDFSYFPNPTSNELTVHQSTVSTDIYNEHTDNAGKPFNIKLYDKSGNILKEGSSKKGEDLNVNTSTLLNGTYFLHIFQGKTVIKKQIIVNH